ncbi:hypothetical protein C0J52_24414 [Blattella germanica]|nr:hypothetical protein C0J52_24414 [Blattella germanica]
MDNEHSRRPLRIPTMTSLQRGTRCRWARERLHWNMEQWRQILFRDECRICLMPVNRQVRVWRETGKIMRLRAATEEWDELDPDRLNHLVDSVLRRIRAFCNARGGVEPKGFRKQLQWLAKEYNNPPIFVTENGYSDHGALNDTWRIKYITGYLSEMLKAIHIDSCNVIGYSYWSFMDNFEWNAGYTQKFGIYQVDFNNPARTRTAKASVEVYKEIIRTRRIPVKYKDYN